MRRMEILSVGIKSVVTKSIGTNRVGTKSVETKQSQDQGVGSRAASLPAKNVQKLESR